MASFFDTLNDNAIGVVVLVILLSIAVGILVSQRDAQTANSTAYNISNAGITNVETFSDNIGTIVTIVIAVVLIGAVMVIKRMNK